MNADVETLEKDLVNWVVQWNAGESDQPVDAETDLSGTGLLDSMAIVGLIAYLEEEADTAFDFSTFDPSEGVTVRGLIEHCLG